MSLWRVYTDPEETPSIILDEFLISSIKRRPNRRKYRWEKKEKNTNPTTVFTIMKSAATWGKRSTKTGDYGWLPGIPDWCRASFTLDSYEKDGLPTGYSFTKSGAYKIALDSATKELKQIKSDLKNNQYDEEDVPEIEKYIKLYEKMISKLKGLYTKSKNRR